jgi:probable rRNA maturation factor
MARLTLSVRGHARVEPLVQRALVRILRRAMTAAGVEGEIALSLSDDAELRRLNRQFAGEDHATDVLSFSQAEGAGPRLVPRSGRTVNLLGDIVISVPTARRQMKTSLLGELVHLSVHGLAHLLGYDHATPEEERVMFGYESKLREAARAPGPARRVRRP